MSDEDEKFEQLLSQHSPEERTVLEDLYHKRWLRWSWAQEAIRPLREGQMRFAELSVRSLLVLNGGAALALIAFAGNATKDGNTPQVLAVYADAVLYFGLGACGAVAVAGLSYLSQTLFVEANEYEIKGFKIGYWTGAFLRSLAVVIWLLSLGAFFYGILFASAALSPPG